MTTDMLDFLGQVDPTTVEPVVDTEFVGGFIGMANLYIRYNFMSPVLIQPEDVQTLGLVEKPAVRGPTTSGKYFYYFKDKAQANLAFNFCSAGQGGGFVSRVTTVRLPMADMITRFTSDDAKAKWGEAVSGDVTMSGFNSQMGYSYNLLFVPSLVHAIALAHGMIETGQEDIFHIGEVEHLSSNFAPDDAWQKEYIGVGRGEWKQSTLGKRRTALWQALGEDDAEANNPIGIGGKETKSEKLSKCLWACFTDWTKPQYVYMRFVYDLRVLAADKKRYSFPVITRLFANEQEARQFAGEDAAPVRNLPGVPADWQSIPDAVRAFEDAMTNYIKKNPLPPLPVRPAWFETAAKPLAADVDTLKAWVEALGL